ncbi:phosphonoacetaldehyde hydrolase [Rubrobacter tropicus]|uniref:Phosphonoacetaldehyde hydrolase n=1 Tax=Rubrobacter tropicus TaxID=2653851 RepID=A0A6G8Q4C0_9ACTN|nr:phosphonoacetaldehyde hydrolase [Rubrobacter tropicus]QIN81322.1 phosphonoacetaldehyde hydrolase [Rubrobacter tropicus]
MTEDRPRFTYSRVYTGPVRAVVFDWAGTTVDYGSLAPVAAFAEVFRRRGVELSAGQIRGPMGTAKRDHILSLTRLEAVREAWISANGSSPSEDDVDEMFGEFEPLLVESAAAHAGLIPGTLETVAWCRERDIRVGSSSGYGRGILGEILPIARDQGYKPDTLVCPEDVPAGRPYPWAMYRAAMDLDVYPMAAIVKVGDTVADVEEGLNAGSWTVGLARSGNELGLGEDEVEALDGETLAAKLEAVYDRLRGAGAHYVVDTIADVPGALEDISARLRTGECP